MRRTEALSCFLAGIAYTRFQQLRALRQSAGGQGTLAALADHMTTTKTVPTAKAARHACLDMYAQPMFHSKLGYESIARICVLQVSPAGSCLRLKAPSSFCKLASSTRYLHYLQAVQLYAWCWLPVVYPWLCYFSPVAVIIMLQ